MPAFKEKSNVLFRGMKLSGGAPRSAYEYLNVFKIEGHNITAVVCDSDRNLKELYERTFDRVILEKYAYEYFEKRNFIAMYHSIKNEYQRLKNEKPDLVIVLGYFNMHFYGYLCRSCSIPSIMMIAGGDLSKSDAFLEKCLCDHVICFSEENKDVLKQFFDIKNISVISNRIHIKKLFGDINTHYILKPNDTLNILLTSRVSDDKYDSIIGFIKTIDSIAGEKRKISLSIAGAGNCFAKLQDDLQSIKNSYLNIEIKGHIDDLLPEFEKTHIVVGKGRSVLEPMMMNRIGCVIGDDGRLEVCTTENFDNLYHYNFSGRHLEKDDPQAELSGLIDSLIDGTFDFSDFEKTVELIRKNYSAEYLPDKLHKVLDSIEEPKKGFSFVSPLLLTLRYIWLKTIRKIRRRFYNGK